MNFRFDRTCDDFLSFFLDALVPVSFWFSTDDVEECDDQEPMLMLSVSKSSGDSSSWDFIVSDPKHRSCIIANDDDAGDNRCRIELHAGNFMVGSRNS